MPREIELYLITTHLDDEGMRALKWFIANGIETSFVVAYQQCLVDRMAKTMTYQMFVRDKFGRRQILDDPLTRQGPQYVQIRVTTPMKVPPDSYKLPFTRQTIPPPFDRFAYVHPEAGTLRLGEPPPDPPDLFRS